MLWKYEWMFSWSVSDRFNSVSCVGTLVIDTCAFACAYNQAEDNVERGVDKDIRILHLNKQNKVFYSKLKIGGW